MESDITRRVAIYKLLEMPDPPDLHRGHIARLEGKPDRHDQLPVLAAAFARGKLLEFRLRATTTH